MRTLLVLIITGAALSGCIGSDAPDKVDASTVEAAAPSVPTATASETAPVNVTTADTPEWRVGDAWAITAGDPSGSTSSILAVAAAGSGGYTLVTTHEQLAIFDAVTDISYLGKIRASDLAGAQQGQPVRFFDFPLEDGKTWTTTWDGLEVQLTATLNPTIATPLGAQPGFVIQGTHADAPYVTYDYVPALKWWSHIDFGGGYSLKVDRVLTNWTGSYVTAAAETVFESATEAPILSSGSGAFTVAEGQSALVAIMSGGAPKYARSTLFVDPAGQPTTPEEAAEVAAEPMGFWRVVFLPPTPGEWHASTPTLHEPEGHFTIQVSQVVLDDRMLAAA